MKRWRPKTYLLLAVGIIVLSNAVALGGVAWNRSGEPESQLKLSLRELNISYSDFGSENSGLSLKLEWCAPLAEHEDISLGCSGWSQPVWLDHQKMLALGFEQPEEDEQEERPRSTTREVFIVLENAGPTWQKHSQRVRKEFDRRTARIKAEADDKHREAELESNDHWLQHEINQASRLFFIDAGLDAAALRLRYPDRALHAIVRGRVASSFDKVNNKTLLSGSLREILANTVNVPYVYRKELKGTSGDSLRDAARKSFKDAEFSVAFGRRLEPWLVGMTKKPAAPEQPVDPSHQD